MDETSNSLLHQIRAAPTDDAWAKFIACYTPFLCSILRSRGVTSNDIDDIIQNVLAVVVRRIPEFERQRTGSFRTWLRVICANCFREHCRSQQKRGRALGQLDSMVMKVVDELSDSASDLSRHWEKQHDEFVLARLLDNVKHEFRESTFEAFRRLAIEGENVDLVVRDLGISVNAAFVARSRVLKRLREMGAGLID